MDLCIWYTNMIALQLSTRSNKLYRYFYPPTAATTLLFCLLDCSFINVPLCLLQLFNRRRKCNCNDQIRLPATEAVIHNPFIHVPLHFFTKSCHFERICLNHCPGNQLLVEIHFFFRLQKTYLKVSKTWCSIKSLTFCEGISRFWQLFDICVLY